MAALPKEMQIWFNALSPDRRDVIVARMDKTIANRDGVWDDDTDPVLVEEVWISVVEHMYLTDLRDEWAEKGFVEVTGIAGDGDLVFTITDKGRKAGL